MSLIVVIEREVTSEMYGWPFPFFLSNAHCSLIFALAFFSSLYFFSICSREKFNRNSLPFFTYMPITFVYSRSRTYRINKGDRHVCKKRKRISKSICECHGVIVMTPEPNSISTASSLITVAVILPLIHSTSSVSPCLYFA